MDVLQDNIGVLLSGYGITILLVAVSGPCSLLGGVFVAGARVSPVPILRFVGAAYVLFFRNVPSVVIFFFCVFVLPPLGIQISLLASALIALSLYYTGYFAEAVRAAVQAIPAGQIEACRALGMGFTTLMRTLVIPQSLANAVPTMATLLIALVRSSAVAGAFGVADLFGEMFGIVSFNESAVLLVLIAGAGLYLTLTLPMQYVADRLERRYGFVR
jgi:glutamate transport system permease protein